MASRGYDMTPTMYSPDGRIYQVEYAIETVKRGAIAIGLQSKDGIVIAVEEVSRDLQVEDITQKIFQVDDHVGIAAAGYIPDARILVDNARFFSQSNKIVYDESVTVEIVAKHMADQCQQYTQYAGARPIGVSLIFGGIDVNGNSLFLTDPSGTYIPYNAVAIGADSDKVTEFLTKEYKAEMTLEETKLLAIASINMVNKDVKGSEHIKISQIKADTKQFEILDGQQISGLMELAIKKYPIEEK